jgi:alpha-tubulin suppressor-like RCC1 family protein
MSLKKQGYLCTAVCLVALAGAWGCGEAAVPSSADEGQTGTAVATLTTVPTGVTCLQLVYSGTLTTSPTFTLTPGTNPATVSLGVLPIGTLNITPKAFSVACSSVTSSTVPTWLGSAVSVVISAGNTAQVALVLRPNTATTGTVDFVPAATAISANKNASYALLSDGTVRAWGWNESGELGNGTTTNSSLPVTVSNLTNVASLASGGGSEAYHMCALRKDKTAACWGMADAGQLGNGATPDISTLPVNVSTTQPLSSIGVGGSSTFALTTSGQGLAWGFNGYFNLNDGTSTSRNVPTLMTSSPAVFEQIASGEASILGRNGSTVYGWGDNSAGQLGTGATSGYGFVTTTFGGGLWPVFVASGAGHSCVVLSPNGIVKCSGYNSDGQLGDGTTTNRSSPVAVSGLTNVMTLAAGNRFTCALKNDKTVWCWGQNDYGQLGDDTFIDRLTPVQVVGLTDAITIAAGGYHMCAIRSDSTVACWGNNMFGSLGDGTTFNRPVPTKVKL